MIEHITLGVSLAINAALILPALLFAYEADAASPLAQPGEGSTGHSLV